MPSHVARLLLVLAAAIAVSGCLASPPAAPADLPATDKPPRSGASGSGAAAAWAVGDDWSYQVAGSRVGESYVVRAGVVAAGPARYEVAVDHPRELALGLTGVGGVLPGEVDAVTLAPRVTGASRDLIGLDEPPGGAWQVVFLGTMFTLQRGASSQLDAAAPGAGVGHRVHGTAANGETLLVEYTEAAGWFTRLEWRDAKGSLLVGYLLLDRPGAGTAGLTSWRTLDAERVSALAGRVGTASVLSDGAADLVLFAAIVGPAGTFGTATTTKTTTTEPSSGGGGLIGRLLDHGTRILPGYTATTGVTTQTGLAVATVIDPGDARVFEFRSTGGEFQFRAADDRAGMWQLVASTGGPGVDLVMYRVAAHTYA